MRRQHNTYLLLYPTCGLIIILLFLAANLCVETPSVESATITINSRFYKQNATIDCYTGQEFPDGDVSKTITCDDSATGVNWTDTGYDACQRKCA